MSAYAIIKTGGKQYRVSQGDLVTIEKLGSQGGGGAKGDTVHFEEVLLVGGDTTIIGEPTVAGARVSGTIVEQDRDAKILIHKHKRRKNYRRTMGHRQYITRVRITDIVAG